MRWWPFILLFIACTNNNQTSQLAPDSELHVNVSTFINLIDTTQVQKNLTQVKLSFGENALSFSAVLKEENLRYQFSKRDTTIWKDPCIELFFDPLADGKNYYEMQFNVSPQIWDLKLVSSLSPINAPQNMREWDIGDSWKVMSTGTINDPKDKDEEWVLEGHISWDKFPEGKPQPGDRWAYNIMRVDYDSKDQPTFWVAQPTGKEMIHYPKTWPVITF